MSFYDLPKTDSRKAESESMQIELQRKFLELIKDIEKQNNYKFKSFEIDNMLLSVIKKNHEAYLHTAFVSP